MTIYVRQAILTFFVQFSVKRHYRFQIFPVARILEKSVKTKCVKKDVNKTIKIIDLLFNFFAYFRPPVDF